jgi:hypothetical protein
MRSVVVLLLLATTASAQQTFDLKGYVAGRAINATGPESWLEGDWGRLESGGDRDEVTGVAQVGIDWTPSRYFDMHVSGAAREDGVGLVEAYADVRAIFGLDEVQLRAGQFFLPTSRENKDPLWASPYTINFSALNTWIGEEVRPIGVDLEWRHTTGRGHVLTTAATAFRGNDTMGTLLGWRGWSVGSRLSTYDEVLPLPPVETLETFFFRQRDDGTKPFGRDLDGRTGYAGRVRYSLPPRASIQYTYLDNRGDRLLYRGEYAWETSFHLISAEFGDPDDFAVAAEYMTGKTGMGTFAAFVQADFYAAYVLISKARGRNRWTARYELFDTTEKDFSPAESNDENGRSWTLTWMFDLRSNIRLAGEFTQFTGARVNTPDPDARTFTLEGRYRF